MVFAIHWPDLNQPWIYMCSPSRCPLPPPSPSHPSGSSQCTSPERLSHASNLGWWSVSPLTVYFKFSLSTKYLKASSPSPKGSLTDTEHSSQTWQGRWIKWFCIWPWVPSSASVFNDSNIVIHMNWNLLPWPSHATDNTVACEFVRHSCRTDSAPISLRNRYINMAAQITMKVTEEVIKKRWWGLAMLSNFQILDMTSSEKWDWACADLNIKLRWYFGPSIVNTLPPPPDLCRFC